MAGTSLGSEGPVVNEAKSLFSESFQIRKGIQDHRAAGSCTRIQS